MRRELLSLEEINLAELVLDFVAILLLFKHLLQSFCVGPIDYDIGIRFIQGL
jgi:hypothetical protein